MHFQMTVAFAAAALFALNSAGNAQSQIPAAIAAPGETAIATIHAQVRSSTSARPTAPAS